MRRSSFATGRPRRFAALLLLLIPPLAAALPASAADIALVARVSRGMSHDPVAGQQVALHILRGNEELPGTTKSTDSQGTARFDRLPDGADLEYYLTTEYKGAVYTEGPLRPGHDGSFHHDIVVYDVGKEIDKVSIASHHVILERQPDGLHVNEIMIIENTADTAYLGIGANHAENAGMRLGLPASIRGFAPGVGGDEGTLVVQGREMMSLRPIPPGQRPLSFTYHVPLSGRVDLSHRFYFPTRSFVVMIDDPKLKLESKALSYAGSREQGGKKYEMYTGSNLDIGSEVEIRVHGADFWANPAIYPWLAVPFLIVGILAFARRMSAKAPVPGAPAARAASHPAAPAGAAPRASAPAAPRNEPRAPSTNGDDLAQTYAYLIAALDQGRDKGEISADSHALLRSNLKRRLEVILSDEPVARGR